MKLVRRYTLVLLTLLVGFVIPTSQTQDKRVENTVEPLIRTLYSTDDAQRRSAKEQLVEFGSLSVKPLLDFLYELAVLGGPRFPIGKEREGAEAIERYKAVHQVGESRARVVEEFNQLEISERLKDDVCEVLGKVKAAESIPKLIEIMELRETNNGDEHLAGEMAVLAHIAEPAVAALIETIEKADTIAAGALEGTELDESLNKAAVKRSMIQRRTQLIKLRASIVLGEIGDATALPVLESLPGQELSDYEGGEYFKMRVRQSIQKIHDRRDRNPDAQPRPNHQSPD